MILKQCLNFKSIIIQFSFLNKLIILNINRYFNEVEINEMTQNILKYEETIERLSCYAPEGCGNIPWPVGIPPPFKPPTRYDVLRYDYFNETHIYLKTDNDVIDKMKGIIFEL